jgi:tetratricopeptide (TPR) repeat protein
MDFAIALYMRGEPGGEMKREALTVALLILVTLAIYLPNLGDTFLNWDYDQYYTVLNGPVGLEPAIELFRDTRGTAVAGYYAPLASVSLMLDRIILGINAPNPQFTHLLNVLFHCLNGVLAYLLIRLVGGSPLCAGVCAFLFLAHPLQVASVLWFAQRKTVLSTCFYLLSYLLYLRARPERSWTPYIGALVCFAAGLLTKPVIVILPVVLLVTECLIPPEGLAQQDSLGEADSGPEAAHRHGRSWIRTGITALAWLTPFFALAVVCGLLGLGSEPTTGLDYPPLWERPFIAARTLLFYAMKAVFPIHLQGIYPRWDFSLASPEWWFPAVVALAATAGLIMYRRYVGPRVYWGLANFFIPLLPAAGLVAFGYFQHSFVADHFAYVSLLGFGYLTGLAVDWLLRSGKRQVHTATIFACGAYGAFIVSMAISQAMLWKDPVALWSSNAALNPRSWAVHSNLGNALMERGKVQPAISHLEKSLEIAPRNAPAHFSLVLGLEMSDRIQEALKAGKRGLELAPHYAPLHARVANVYVKAGDLAEAEKHYKKALDLNPYFSDVHNDYGIMLEKASRLDEAIKQFQLALQLQPGFTRGYVNLGLAFEEKGDLSSAIASYQKAVEMYPHDTEARTNLGTALLKAKDVPQALLHLQEAVRLQPTNARAESNLGSALVIAGKPAEAVPHLKRALHLNPNLREARENLELAQSLASNSPQGSKDEPKKP